MIWDPKVGEIGRFWSESDKQPRFVVVRVLRNIVQIWYSGATKTQSVPRRTFLSDCMDTWVIDIIDSPTWLKPEVKFRLDGWVTLAQVINDPQRPRTSTRTERMDLTGHDLEVFSIHRDHVACAVPGLKTIVLIPLKVINERGSRLRTRWEMILEDDDFDDFEEYL